MRPARVVAALHLFDLRDILEAFEIGLAPLDCLEDAIVADCLPLQGSPHRNQCFLDERHLLLRRFEGLGKVLKSLNTLVCQHDASIWPRGGLRTGVICL